MATTQAAGKTRGVLGRRRGLSYRAALAGASGLVGRALAQAMSADPACAAQHLLLRRPLPALEALPNVQVIAWDGSMMPALPPLNMALCALGTTIKAAGSQAAFRAVDHDTVLGFANAARSCGARHFAMVSAVGADARSQVFYNRVKGEIEDAVVALGFERLVIARPSLLLGDRHALGQPIRPAEALAQMLAPALAWFTPRRLHPIQADAVARAILRALRAAGPAVQVLENDELQRLGQAD